MSLTINVKPKGFAEAEKALKGIKNAFPRTMAESINYGLRAGTTMAAKLVKQRYNIKSADIKGKGLDVDKANYSKLHGSLTASGSMLPVSLFDPQVKRGVMSAKGRVGKSKGGARSNQYVKAAIVRKGGRKLIRGGFIILGNKVFERRTDARLPIGPVMTIGLPYMVGYLGIAKQVEDIIRIKTEERLEHKVNFELSKAAR